MKAKIKDSGEIIDVAYIGNGEWCVRNNISQCCYAERELEFLDNTTDWSQVRIQAAIAAMQAFCHDETLSYKKTAEMAVSQADALIAELKREGGKE